MKFPRNAKHFKGQLDAAPFAGVFLCLVLFLLLNMLVYTPGVKLSLPAAANLSGISLPSIAVAIDAQGRFFFENRMVDPADLKSRLGDHVRKAGKPLTLVVQADKAASYESIMSLTLLAREAGILDALLATLPRPYEPGDPNPALRR